MTIWVDGALVDDDAARISPMDHGLLTGDGVFETLRVYDGVPFAWTRHVERLGRSAGALGLVPPDGATLREAADAVIRSNGRPEARLRIIEDLEPGPRGYYCGAVGWIDTGRQRADLAVAIRTFTVTDGATTFGTGAGITVGSDPAAEWAETELKAARLLAAAGSGDRATHRVVSP